MVFVIRAKRVSNCYIPKKKSVRVSCVRLILVLVGSVKRYCCRTYDTRYVCTWYQPAEIYTYVRYVFVFVSPFCFSTAPFVQWVVVRMIPTFRPWTHTSDDSYIYQLSLVIATATVSLVCSLQQKNVWYVPWYSSSSSSCDGATHVLSTLLRTVSTAAAAVVLPFYAATLWVIASPYTVLPEFLLVIGGNEAQPQYLQ